MSVDVKNFKPSKNFEAKCLKDLEKIRDKILSIFKKYSNSAFNIPDLLKQITNTKDFQEFTDTLAKRFFARCVDKNNDTFRKSFFGRAYKIFKNLTGDKDLITFIRNQVNEKANLFKSIPVELANSLIPHVNKWALEGKTSKGIFDDLKNKLPDLLDFQIRRIARTEISKTLTDITEFKCGQGEVNIYQWKASGGERGDGRTRYSHRKMANVLIMWGDPPAPEDLFPIYGKNGKRYKNTLGHYHAGCCPNCRCVAMPVVSISDIEFPAHIYMNGAIRKINKQDLIKLLKIKSTTEEEKTIELFDPEQFEEEQRKAEEEARRLEEEVKKAEEEARRLAEEAERKAKEEQEKEEARLKAEEEERKRKEQEAKEFEEKLRKAEEERQRRIAELRAKQKAEEEARQKEKEEREKKYIQNAKLTKEKIEKNRIKIEKETKEDQNKSQEELTKETVDFLDKKLGIKFIPNNFTEKDQVINIKKSFKQIEESLSAIISKEDRKFFDINSRIKTFGTNQDLFEKIKADFLDANLTPIVEAERRRIGRKPHKKWIEKKEKEVLNILKDKISLLDENDPTVAFAISDMVIRRLINSDDSKGLYGIYANYNYLENFNEKYEISTTKNYNSFIYKEHPPFTDNAEGTIYHEWGHILANIINFDTEEELREIFEEDLKNYKKYEELEEEYVNQGKFISFKEKWDILKSQDENFDFMSFYAFTFKDLPYVNPHRVKEFTAEAVAEFFSSPNPRPVALKVWGLLEQKIKEYIEKNKKWAKNE
jgi:hypothetical protein